MFQKQVVVLYRQHKVKEKLCPIQCYVVLLKLKVNTITTCFKSFKIKANNTGYKMSSCLKPQNGEIGRLFSIISDI